MPSESGYDRCGGKGGCPHDRNPREALGVGNGGGSGNRLAENKSGRNLFGNHAVVVFPRRAVPGGRPRRVLPGRVASFGALGTVKACGPVAEFARSNRRSENGSPR